MILATCQPSHIGSQYACRSIFDGWWWYYPLLSIILLYWIILPIIIIIKWWFYQWLNHFAWLDLSLSFQGHQPSLAERVVNSYNPVGPSNLNLWRHLHGTGILAVILPTWCNMQLHDPDGLWKVEQCQTPGRDMRVNNGAWLWIFRWINGWWLVDERLTSD